MHEEIQIKFFFFFFGETGSQDDKGDEGGRKEYQVRFKMDRRDTQMGRKGRTERWFFELLFLFFIAS